MNLAPTTRKIVLFVLNVVHKFFIVVVQLKNIVKRDEIEYHRKVYAKSSQGCEFCIENSLIVIVFLSKK